MAKKKTSKLFSVLPIVGVVLAIAAVICFAGAFTSVTASVTALGTTTTTQLTVSGFAAAFKGEALQTITMSGNVTSATETKIALEELNGGILAAFILLLVGILGTTAANLIKMPRVARASVVLLSVASLLTAGILVFCSRQLLANGESIEGVKLGIGAILGGIFAVSGSVLAGTTCLNR